MSDIVQYAIHPWEAMWLVCHAQAMV